MEFTAIIVGATGLVGSHLVELLIEDKNCKELKLITRRATNYQNPKITECIIDFNNINDYKKYIKGDVLFSCLGTTLKQAGNKENQYLVDYTYQYRAAKSAFENNVSNYILVSSPWAKLESNNYYRKMKAQLEEIISKLPFKKTIIIKPNGLIGKRSQPRFGEKYATTIFSFLIKIFPVLKKHQPIEAKKVAKAMLNSFYKENHKNIDVYSRNEVLILSNWRIKL